MRDVLLFLAKFLALSAVLFVLFTWAEEGYNMVLAYATAVTAPLTGASVGVIGVEGNVMKLRYAGMEITESLIFAAYNPVILIALLVATPRARWRILSVGVGGLVLLLPAQVVTLRLMLAIDARGYRGTPGLELLEVAALVSICVNWILPIIIWVVWVPTGFLAQALKLGPPAK